MILLLIKSFMTGVIAGLIFALFKLPIPAPTAFAGIIGIVGIYIGYIVIKIIIK